MGACSSKPKTTEFEGSMQPSKKTEEVAADQTQTTERSLENPADEHGKEAPSKSEAEGKEAPEVSGDGTAQATCAPDVGKKEEPSEEVVASSAYGDSEAKSDVLGEKEAVKKEADGKAEQKEGNVDLVAAEVVQKDYVDSGGAAADNVPDESKSCEDKAVVLEETGRSSEGEAPPHLDKTVEANEEKTPETPEKRSIIVPEGAGSAPHLMESPALESPIIGVVQPVDPVKEDVSAIVSSEPEKNAVDVTVDEDPKEVLKVGQESAAGETGDGGAHASAYSEVKNDALEPTGEASSECVKAPAKVDPLKHGEGHTPQPEDEAPSKAVEDLASPPASDSQISAEKEGSEGTEAKVFIEESVVFASTVKDGGSVELAKPKATESVDSEVTIVESKAEDAAQESAMKKDGPTAELTDSNDGKSAVETAAEDGEAKATLNKATPEDGKESLGKPQIEHAVSSDVVFEDASDAPLKLEASNSIEKGQIPN